MDSYLSFFGLPVIRPESLPKGGSLSSAATAAGASEAAPRPSRVAVRSTSRRFSGEGCVMGWSFGWRMVASIVCDRASPSLDGPVEVAGQRTDRLVCRGEPGVDVDQADAVVTDLRRVDAVQPQNALEDAEAPQRVGQDEEEVGRVNPDRQQLRKGFGVIG